MRRMCGGGDKSLTLLGVCGGGRVSLGLLGEFGAV